MKALKMTVKVEMDEMDDKFGHYYTAIIRPMRKEFSHLSRKVHDVCFDGEHGYSIDDGECLHKTTTSAIKHAKELLIHNDVVDYAFDNNLEDLIF